MSALPTSESAGSLLPTPRPQTNGGGAAAEDPPGRQGGPNLMTAVSLLRTPTAQLAVNGGSQHPDKRKAGGHGPTLADEVEHLLPTPNATHERKMSRTGPLLHGIAALLPTPMAADGGLSRGQVGGGGGSGFGLRNTAREISSGDSTQAPSEGGRPSSAAQLPGQLSLDELESA